MAKFSHTIMSTVQCCEKDKHGVQCPKMIKVNVIIKKGREKPIMCYKCYKKQ
jgi:hypothetical protein